MTIQTDTLPPRTPAEQAEQFRRRAGRFYVRSKLLDQQPDLWKALMREVCVFRCEEVWWARGFEYHALSDHFDVIEPGRMLPEYEATITEQQDDDGGKTYQITFARVEGT